MPPQVPPLDTSIQAKYADGFILSETELDDISPYNPEENVLRAVINRDPEVEHGPLVEFTVFWQNMRYDMDWTKIPDNARPIRFRDGNVTVDDKGNQTFWWSGCRFGYQYTNEDGKNVQEVIEAGDG